MAEVPRKVPGHGISGQRNPPSPHNYFLLLLFFPFLSFLYLFIHRNVFRDISIKSFSQIGGVFPKRRVRPEHYSNAT
jgi:cytochrome b subunit of formate dehydrogenase